jgi:acyl carrier protein
MRPMDAIETEILAQLKRLVEVDPKPQDSLALIGLDSVALAELTFELEKAFNVRFDEDIVEIETVGELVEYVRSKTGSVKGG